VSQKAAILVLESGRAFRGRLFGATHERTGEVVFNTPMTGYQEIVTDPSYAGQIVVMTAPQIGNVGVNDEDIEARIPACAGLVVRELSPLVSNWRARGTLEDYLREHGVAGIEGVDTRAITRAIREGGAQRGLVAAGSPGDEELAALVEKVRSSPAMEGLDLVPGVTVRESYTWDEPSWRGPGDTRPVPPADLHVVAYDFGIKQHILRDLRDAGCRVTVVPATTQAADALALDADGYFLSNGPGDPAAVTYGIEAVKGLIDSGKPVFGICLGHQILALAAGAKTFKLPFGHHGGNHPVKDLATGKVEITSQNHGFAVERESLPAGVSCTHINLYDDTVEGIRLDGRPVFGVQYHPEASPGPRDASYLFGRFVAAMRGASPS
jgi:carbamoyl-phosphate synthase small subunit